MPPSPSFKTFLTFPHPLPYLPVTPLSPPFSFSSSSQFSRLNISHQFITSPVLLSPSLILSPSPSTTLTAPSLTPFILFPTFFHLSPSSSLSPSPSPSPSLTDSLPYFLHPLTHLLSSLSLIFHHPFTFSYPLTFYHPLPFLPLVPFFTFFSSPPSLPLHHVSSSTFLYFLNFPHLPSSSSSSSLIPLLHLSLPLSLSFLVHFTASFIPRFLSYPSHTFSSLTPFLNHSSNHYQAIRPIR